MSSSWFLLCVIFGFPHVNLALPHISFRAIGRENYARGSAAILRGLDRVVGERFLLLVRVLISAVVVFLRHFELPYQEILLEFCGGTRAAPTIVLIGHATVVGYPKPADYYFVGKRVDGNEGFDFEEKGDLVEFADYHRSNEVLSSNSVEGMMRKKGPVLMRREEADGALDILDDGSSGTSSIEEEDDRPKHLAKDN